MGDSQAPSAPGTLSAVGAIGRATLSWGAATDNVGVVRYNVHRGTSAGFVASVANRIAQPTTPGYVDNTTPGSYFYKVTAEDAAGNIGPVSNEAAATVTADTSAPSAPTGLSAPVTGNTVNLSWTAATDNVGSQPLQPPPRHARPASPPRPATGSHSRPAPATATAASASAATSTRSPPRTPPATSAPPPTRPAPPSPTRPRPAHPQTSPPAPPAAPSTSAGPPPQTTSASAATTSTAAARAGFTPTAGNRIAQPTGTSYSDTGLAAGTYFYKLTAEDAAGNISALSNTANATVADTTPPSTPTGLNASGGAGQANLSWTASTDNVGVSRYNLHRSTSSGFTPTTANRIAQPTGTSHTDTSLAAGTYYYKLTAEDAAGNISPASNQATATVTAPPVTGLVAAYGLDEGTGTVAADSSGNGNTGSISGATWAIGKFGTALSFDGVNDVVNVRRLDSLDLTTGMTLEAWVYPRSLGTVWRTIALKEQPGNYAYAIYGSTDTSRPSANVVSGGLDRDLRGTSTLALNNWAHVAATYDATTLRLYIDGALVSSVAASGSITTSSGALRLGGNTIWGEYFDGLIDEVRVYNRALTQAQVQTDMAVGAATDVRDPTIVASSPPAGSTDLPIDTRPSVTFSEAMNPATINGSTFELTDGSGAAVAGAVTYDPVTARATFVPDSGLVYATSYTARLHGGPTGARDMAGRSVAADLTWTFSLEAVPPPIAVLTAPSNPFTQYLQEILRTEGLSFASFQASLISATVLSHFDTVVLGEMSLTPAQVTTLTNWVAAGGNLIAMRPDKQLASLLGVSDAGTTLANAYLKTDCCTQAGAGVTSQSIQYHGTADRYTLSGATKVATLYSNASTATTSPAVTLRDVGANGGQAAAFTYDLARSIVLTRQGNPAWVGQERDGVVGIRPDDLFFGAKAGDVQPDWLDINKIGIPQADEQQRLLANLIVTMAADRKPVPRFWYLPRGEKAAVVMTGDDHAFGGTAGRFEQYKTASPAGCSVAAWECVRSTSYIFQNSPLTSAQANSYVSQGFEVAVHVTVGGLDCLDWTPSGLTSVFSTQLQQFRAKYTGVPALATHRLHCVGWADWATLPKVELANGMRLDTNYYHFPSAWIGSRPGFMTGSGMIMRFADSNGAAIDVYQAHTHMNDEASQQYPATVNFLLDGALGANGYYGIFTVNMHTDQAASTGSDAIVASALARGVPIVSAKQMLDWVDGRNNSSLRDLSWTGNTFSFSITQAPGATGLQAMLPIQSRGQTLATITRAGTPVSYTTDTIKGIAYAFFPAATGSYAAVYAP